MATTAMTEFNLDQSTQFLQKKYKVVDIIRLNDYVHPEKLFLKIKSLKKEVFAHNERIVFVYSENKIAYLREVLEFLDIPIFFIILLVPKQLSIATFEISNIIYYTGEIENNLKKFDIAENHCIYPWTTVRIDNLGLMHPCCIYESSSQQSINETSLKTNYLSRPFVKIRDNFRNNLKTKECNACWRDETAGIKSMRMNSKFKFKDIYYKIDYHDDDFNNLKILDMCLGNKCNLECKICSETSSSKIADTSLKNNTISIEKYNDIKKLTRWAESDLFYNQLLEVANNLIHLDIYGGEPFMNKAHLSLLKKLIELGYSKNISLEYNSNGTLYSDNFFTVWEKFKSVKISFSIDDINERFEYQRSGASWRNVENNIAMFNKHLSSWFHTDVYPTINCQNVYYLPELLEWISNNSFDQGVSFNILKNPEYLAIQNLPTLAKEKIEKKLKNYNMLSPIVTYMKNQPISSIGFVDYLNKLPKHDQENFLKSHREFASILSL